MDLNERDAFADHKGTPSRLVAVLGPQDGPAPLVTIAIPTFRRPEYLPRVVQSALDQAFEGPVEIIIVDNDDDEASRNAILASLPQNPARTIRYYTNAENIGMFGNWNRCIELAQGEWVTLLNDDDLLRPRFLQRVFRAIRRRPDTDGIVCKKLNYNWDTGRIVQSSLREAVKHAAFRWRFDIHNLTRATPRKLFFGNELDNGCGFLFRRAVAIADGGYRKEEFPASDFFFYIRFTLRHNLYWLNEVLADIGIGENESMRKSTIMSSIGLASSYYETMTRTCVPRDWLRLRPQLTANQIEAYRTKFGVTFTPEELAVIEANLGAPLPPPDYGRIRRFRLLHRGF